MKKLLTFLSVFLLSAGIVLAANNPFYIPQGGTGTTTFKLYDIPFVKTATSMSAVSIGTAGQCLKVNPGVNGYVFGSCGTGSGGGDTLWATSAGVMYPADLTFPVVIGSTATSSDNTKFEVNGNSYFNGQLEANRITTTAITTSQAYIGTGTGLLETIAGKVGVTTSVFALQSSLSSYIPYSYASSVYATKLFVTDGYVASTTLNSYATKLFVTDGYVASTTLDSYATKNFVTTGYLASTTDYASKAFVTTGYLPTTTDYASKAYVNSYSVPTTTLTTAGDILAFSTANGRFPIGTTGYVLQVSSTAPFKMEWVATSTLGISGTTDHAALSNLSYAASGHTGFEPTVTKGNLTAGTGLSIGGSGTGAVIGTGASISAASGYSIPTDSQLALYLNAHSLAHATATENVLGLEFTGQQLNLSSGYQLLTTASSSAYDISQFKVNSSSTNWDNSYFRVSAGTLTDNKLCTWNPGNYLDCNTDPGASSGFTTTTFKANLDVQTTTLTFATDSATGLDFQIIGNSDLGKLTFTPVLQSGYNIPKDASTTAWNSSSVALENKDILWDYAHSLAHPTATESIDGISLTGQAFSLDADYRIPTSSPSFASITSTAAWFTNSTSTNLYFTNASGTNATFSGNTYLGTVKSGVWNGTVIGDAYLTKTGNWTGTIDGNNFSGAIAQGEIMYGTAAGEIGMLAKSSDATRYLSNTGGDNNPAWAQINLANGVTGNLPILNGGTATTTWVKDTIVFVGNGQLTSDPDFKYTSTTNVLTFVNGSSTVFTAPTLYFTNASGTSLTASGDIWAGNLYGVSKAIITNASTTNITATDLWATNIYGVSQLNFTNASGTNATFSGNSYLGTVKSGTWNGTLIGLAYGGTGTTTAPSTDQILWGNAGNTYDLRRLVAGSNITISTSTAGQVVIASTATGGGGANYDLIWATTATNGLLIIPTSSMSMLTADFAIGSNATATAPFWWDVSATTSYIGIAGAGDGAIDFTHNGTQAISLGYDYSAGYFAFATNTDFANPIMTMNTSSKAIGFGGFTGSITLCNFGTSTAVTTTISFASSTVPCYSNEGIVRLARATTTLEISDPPLFGKFDLTIVQGTSTTSTVTWDSEIAWEGGFIPSLPSGTSSVSILSCQYKGAMIDISNKKYICQLGKDFK